MTNQIRKTSVAIKGGPGGAGICVLNPKAKESFGTTGGIFIQRKAAYKPATYQRICTSNLVTLTASPTLDGTDDGDLQMAASASAITVNLPLTTKVGPGYICTVMTGTIPASVGTTVNPQSTDKFAGNGFNGKTAGQTLVNTQATAAVGDQVDLVSDGNGRWFVLNKVGTWA